MRCILALALLLASPTVRADDYRIEVAAADTASAVLFTVGVRDLDSKPRLICGLGGIAGMALAAPIFHAAHDNYSAMGISLGARVLFPAIGLYAGITAKTDEKTAYAGFITGYLIASVIDVVLATEEDPATAARVVSIGGRF